MSLPSNLYVLFGGELKKCGSLTLSVKNIIGKPPKTDTELYRMFEFGLALL